MKYLFLALSLARHSLAEDVVKREGGSSPMEAFYESMNDDLARYSLIALACTAVLYGVWQLTVYFFAHIRRLSTFGDDRQRYFVPANGKFALLKKYLIYAPLFHNRHNREFQLSQAINMGNLPSRVHGLLVAGIVAMNVVLCVVTVPYASNEKTTAGIIRNRTGTMATVNMIPLVIMAGRNNPLIAMLRVPFDTWNLIHRWLGRIVVCEALAHTFAWAIPKAQQCKNLLDTGYLDVLF